MTSSAPPQAPSPPNTAEMAKIANRIRRDVIRMVHAAGCGHPGGPLGLAEIFATLYFQELRLDPENSEHPLRDRLILSNGRAERTAKVSSGLSGRTDRWMMRFCDALEGVPLVVVVLFLLAILQEYRMEMASIGLGRIHLFFLAVGTLFWVPTARVARAEALRLRKAPVVEASRGIGAPTISILLRHILPHLLATVLVMLTLTLPRVVLMEAFLSFLGLGVEAPDVSWGILAREGLETLNPLVDCWWILALPGMALTLTLLALQRLGDGLRDALSSPGR